MAHKRVNGEIVELTAKQVSDFEASRLPGLGELKIKKLEDIRARKMAASAIEQNEKRLAALVDAAEDEIALENIDIETGWPV